MTINKAQVKLLNKLIPGCFKVFNELSFRPTGEILLLRSYLDSRFLPLVGMTLFVKLIRFNVKIESNLQ